MAYTTINKSTEHFNTKLYTGGSGDTAHTGVGFQPDLVWIKERTRTRNHAWFDVIRGSRYWIGSNSADAQDYNSGAYLASFDSDGFTTTDTDVVGKNSYTYASWNWKAGTTGSGTTGGSGTAKAYSYSVNTTAGFSIVKYAGNGSAGHTIPHHLGVVPRMIMIKDLTDNEAWRVYHAGLGNFAKWLELNSTAGETTDSSVFDNVPTSSGFLVGSANPVNNATHDYIAYCFAEKTGYSKFGSYTGNGNADGSFIYTGFKPAFIIVKRNATGAWRLWDSKRNTFNLTNKNLRPGGADTEATSGNEIDILSNGFKARATNGDSNASGGTYLYMAFGQSLVGSNNVPCTAR